MTDTRIRQYEAMFLLSPAIAADMETILAEINGHFERIGAEVVAIKKWDERRLAYEIGKNKRGVYLLSYFRVDTSKVVELERLCQLSENILRVLVVSAEHLTQEEMESAEGRAEMEAEAALREGSAEETPSY